MATEQRSVAWLGIHQLLMWKRGERSMGTVDVMSPTGIPVCWCLYSHMQYEHEHGHGYGLSMDMDLVKDVDINMDLEMFRHRHGYTT